MLVQEGVGKRPGGSWEGVWGIRVVCLQVLGFAIQLVNWPRRCYLNTCAFNGCNESIEVLNEIIRCVSSDFEDKPNR